MSAVVDGVVGGSMTGRPLAGTNDEERAMKKKPPMIAAMEAERNPVKYARFSGPPMPRAQRYMTCRRRRVTS